jgi:hypothetical protein
MSIDSFSIFVKITCSSLHIVNLHTLCTFFCHKTCSSGNNAGELIDDAFLHDIPQKEEGVVKCRVELDDDAPKLQINDWNWEGSVSRRLLGVCLHL